MSAVIEDVVRFHVGAKDTATGEISLAFGPSSLGYNDFSLSKPGTAFFTDWTAQEKAANIREARAIMRRFGFTRVPTWSKTLADQP